MVLLLTGYANPLPSMVVATGGTSLLGGVICRYDMVSVVSTVRWVVGPPKVGHGRDAAMGWSRLTKFDDNQTPRSKRAGFEEREELVGDGKKGEMMKSESCDGS